MTAALPPQGIAHRDPYGRSQTSDCELELWWTVLNQKEGKNLDLAIADTIAHELGYHIMADSVGSGPMGIKGHLHDAANAKDSGFIDAKMFNSWGSGVFSPEAASGIKGTLGF